MGEAHRNSHEDDDDGPPSERTVVQFRPTELLSADLASLRLPANGGKVEESVARETKSEGPSRLPRVLLILGILAVLGVVAFGARQWMTSSRELLTRQLFKTQVDVVEVSSVSPSAAQETLTATGYVVAQTVVRVGSKVVARVTRVHVQEGQQVQKG